jgi:hypothetical protein
MPAEIVFPYPTTGLTTLTARLRTGATVVGSAIALSDSASAGIYLGDVPGGTADGNYDVVVYQAGAVLGASAAPLVWRSNAEVLPAIPGAAMTLTAGERTSIAAAVWGATTRTLSSFGTLIADFWASATRTLTADPGAAAHSATQALVTAAAGVNQVEHDATQVALAAIAAIGDPLANPVPGTYPAGSAGEALGKLVVGPPDEPAVVIPGPPADVGLCRVYGYVERIDNGKQVANLTVEITLGSPTGIAASERIIAGRSLTFKTDAQGRIVGQDGSPWIDLQRNDLLEPAGTYYTITSAAMGVTGKRVTLTTSTADLRTLLLS